MSGRHSLIGGEGLTFREPVIDGPQELFLIAMTA